MRLSRALSVAGLMSGLVLAGCSNSPGLGQGDAEQITQIVRGSIGWVSRDQGATRLQPTSGFPGLDPALLAGYRHPAMGAYVSRTQALAALTLVSSARGLAHWRTTDDVSLTLSGPGVLVATRGLGEDLHAADASQTAALIAAGQAGTAQRRHVYLDGVFAQQRVTLTCTVQPVGPETLVLGGRSLPTLRFDERCEGAGEPIVNSYWRDARGPLIRQSSQWVGPRIGMIHLQRLIE